MGQQTGPLLVQEIAYHLFRTKLLPAIKLTYCQIETWDEASVKLMQYMIYVFSVKYIKHVVYKISAMM